MTGKRIKSVKAKEGLHGVQKGGCGIPDCRGKKCNHGLDSFILKNRKEGSSKSASILLQKAQKLGRLGQILVLNTRDNGSVDINAQITRDNGSVDFVVINNLSKIPDGLERKVMNVVSRRTENGKQALLNEEHGFKHQENVKRSILKSDDIDDEFMDLNDGRGLVPSFKNLNKQNQEAGMLAKAIYAPKKVIDEVKGGSKHDENAQSYLLEDLKKHLAKGNLLNAQSTLINLIPSLYNHRQNFDEVLWEIRDLPELEKNKITKEAIDSYLNFKEERKAS